MGAAAVSILALCLRKICQRIPRPQRIQNVMSFLLILAAAGSVSLMGNSWPDQKDMKWVMGLLFLLAVYGRKKGREQAVDAGILLWWSAAFLFGSILLSSFPAVRGAHLKESLFRSGNIIKELELLTLLLLPLLFPEETECPDSYLTLLPILFSLAAYGTLGRRAELLQAPFYELSRSIRLYGLFDRMEALAWMGMLLGGFLFHSMLLTMVIQVPKRCWIFLISGAIFGVFLGKNLYRGGLLAGGLITVVSAKITGLKNSRKKMKKDEKTS